MITPNFESIPQELQNLHRWVVWRDAKIPYNPALPERKASATNPNTWSTFTDAKTAYREGIFSGVGFVLNGDGLVGVDLDKCVHGGQPDPQAMGLMERIGCNYIELSPSGTGLRGFGYAERPPRNKGIIHGVNVELYSEKRYLTVTGQTLQNGPILPLPGFLEVSGELSPTEENRGAQRTTEDDIGHLLFSSVGKLPADVFPQSEGQRNECLFKLARYLKGECKNASKPELRQIVSQWHKTVYPVIGTKDFSITWADFLRGWEKVRHPHGESMETALVDVDNMPLPAGVEALGYGDAGLRLIKICTALQKHHGSEPFFISSRKAGELLNIHYTDAAKMLKALVADEVISLVSQGAGKTASRYRMKIN